MSGGVHNREKRPKEEEEDEDLVDKLVNESGCAEEHYKVQECMVEHQDWRKCQTELKQFQACMSKNQARRDVGVLGSESH